MSNRFGAPGQGAHQNHFGRPQTGRDMARFPHTQGLPAFKRESAKDADGRPLPVTADTCPFCGVYGGHRAQKSTKGDVEFHSCRKCHHLWATVADKAQLITPGMVREMNRHVFGVQVGGFLSVGEDPLAHDPKPWAVGKGGYPTHLNSIVVDDDGEEIQ